MDKQLMVLEMVPVEKLVVNGENFRGEISAASVAELASSIDSCGLLNALLVREVGDLYQVVAGHRRLAAVKLLGWTEVACNVLQVDSERAVHVQLVENLQRQDIHAMDEARAFDYLINTMKLDVIEVAARVGKSTQYVYKRLKLNTLVPEIQQDLRDNWLPLSVGFVLAGMSKEVQESVYESMAYDHDWRENKYVKKNEWEETATQVKNFIRDYNSSKLSEAKFDLNDDTLHGGACSKCTKNTGSISTLFDEMKFEDAICLDEKCFAFKREEYLRGIIAKNKKKEVVRISENNWVMSEQDKLELGGVTARSEYMERKKEDKECTSKQLGVVVDEDDDYGKTMPICRDVECPVHGLALKRMQGAYVQEAKEKKTPDEVYARRLELIEIPERTELLTMVLQELWQVDDFTGEFIGAAKKPEQMSGKTVAIKVNVDLHFMLPRLLTMLNNYSASSLFGWMWNSIAAVDEVAKKIEQESNIKGWSDKVEGEDDDILMYGQGCHLYGTTLKFFRYFYKYKRVRYEQFRALMLAAHVSHEGDSVLRSKSNEEFLNRAKQYVDVEAIRERVAKNYEEKKAKLLERFVKVNGREPDTSASPASSAGELSDREAGEHSDREDEDMEVEVDE